MTSAVDSTRAIRESARRAYLAGNRRQAFDIYRCDPSVSPAVAFDQFEVSFGRQLVQSDAQAFTEALLKRAFDTSASSDEQLLYHRALSSLERMEPSDVLTLEYSLLRAGPHVIAANTLAEVVLRAMDRL